MRRLIVVVVLLTVGCGGSPTQPKPPQLTTVTISGRVTTTLTGDPIVGASLNFAGRTVTSSSNGQWSLDGQTADAIIPVEVVAAGHLTRSTSVRTQNGRTDVVIDLIRDGGQFSLSFYRQMVRNAWAAPEAVASEPLRRWTRNPSFYVNTTNPKTGASISAAELAVIQLSVSAAVPQATGGLFSVGSFGSGTEQRALADTVTISFVYEPSGSSCAQAVVGANPGLITINYDKCGCNGAGFSAETVAHEVGHAMGFRHTESGIMKLGQSVASCTNTTFSAAELYHARIAYARQPGNMDIDRDGGLFTGLFTAPASAPVAICYR